MSIPIKDLTAGDTVSSMVDKINYNFDLINLAGGGPQGLQGLQGVRGYAGLQGPQGIQGIRGIGWYVPNVTDTEPLDGDLTLDGNDIMVWNSQTETWESTGSSITGDTSPFVHNDTANTINEKDDYCFDPIVLGDNTNNGSIGGNIRKSAIIIANVSEGGGAAYNNGITMFNNASYGSTPATITVAGGSSNDLILRSKKTKVIGGDGSPAYIELSDSNTIKFSPLVGICSDNSVAPVVSANGVDGTLISYTTDGWSWALKGGAIIPNNTAFPNNSVGDNENRVVKIYLDKKSEIIFNTETTPANGEYLSINHSNSGTVGNIIKISKYGLSVGVPKTTIADNFSTYQNGVRIGGGEITKPGTLTMVMPEKQVGSVTSETATPSNVNVLGSPMFTLTLNTNSIDDYRYGDCAQITAKRTSSSGNLASSASSLRIVGGTNASKGNDVIVEGGTGVGQSANATGGDVYLAGGSNIGSNIVSGNQVNGYVYNFGDVVVGVNPNNHPSMRSGSNLSSTRRTNSEDNPNGLTFFDIGKFTAHANKVTLDSDANNRIINGYSEQQPRVSALTSATLQFNGLNTVYSNNPFVVTVENSAKYQLMSGIYSFANLYYKNANTVSVIQGTDIGTLKLRSEYTSSKNDCVFSNITTNWQKVGNVIDCKVKIDLYYSNANGVLLPITQPGRVDSVGTARLYLLKYGILTNIPLPLLLMSNSSVIRNYYTVGNAYAFIERRNRSYTGGKVFESSNLVVNNSISRVNEVSQQLTYSDFITLSHGNDNTLYEQTIPASTSYVSSDSVFTAYATTPKLCGGNTSYAYVIPEYLMTYSDENGVTIKKMQPADRMYASMVVNYSYMLTNGFSTTAYRDFAASNNASPNPYDPVDPTPYVNPTPDR